MEERHLFTDVVSEARERNPEGPASDGMILCGIEVRERP